MKKTFCILLLIALASNCLSGCARSDATPEIKEHEFPFCIEYSIGDKTYVINDTIICEYNGLTSEYGHHSPIRDWRRKLKSTNDEYTDLLIVKEYDKQSFVKNRTNHCVYLFIGMGSAAYYMGEKQYKNTEKPCFYIEECFFDSSGKYSAEKIVLTEKQLNDYFDIQIIQFNFSKPIKNRYS